MRKYCLKMPDFLAEDNPCGQAILQLVSRGNAIIAELHRLKDCIPKIYRLSSKEDIQKYGDIIMDFNYFKIEEAQNNKIENSEFLRDLDKQLKDNHIDMVHRFYLTFESIHTYITDLNYFLDGLNDGYFIHQSLESIFNNMEGKQILCEALYLFGLMLLTVDTFIEGPIRERLLVSYYRHKPQRSDAQSKIDDVCKLFRDTGYSTTRKPQYYPEDYFKRIVIKSIYVDLVIGHLRSDDIYAQMAIYPLTKHRSAALANQASMLYVCLYFDTNILHSQTTVMREIVDKYFPDNWVISLYMGYTVNLSDAWNSFKAAKLALNNTLLSAKEYSAYYGSTVPKLLKSTNFMLKEGNITSESLLKEINNVISLLRDCNCTLRWLMLHSVILPQKVDKNKRVKQLREIVVSESKLEQVHLFKLLLNTAELELITRDVYRDLLSNKNSQWEILKDESSKSLTELSEVFGGSKPLTRIPKNLHLQQWFLEIAKQVEVLNQDGNASARKIAQLIQALEEVQEFHQLDSNMQVVQFLTETRKYLHQMIQNIDIKEDVLITLQIIGDLSYAWELIDSFTPIMQLGIKEEPVLVIKLRAIFLKLASALEIPLLRINQAHSEDLLSVSQYYSSELEIYVRKVLQIIPKMMFEKMARIIEIQTSVLTELPTRLDKDKLKDYAQLNERFEFVQLTHSISVLSQGMRMMKSTLVGVICLDPKKILEDGIRRELVQYLSKALHTALIFNTNKSKSGGLEEKLSLLGQIMNGYKKLFEYIQDYIGVNGLKIWQEEVTRIINYHVEQECNSFLPYKIPAWECAFQNRHVPIPLYPSLDTTSQNFIGRLAREIIRLTDPRLSVYLDQNSTWYDLKTHKATFNKETISLITSAIEVSGLVGLDRLFSFTIISNLQKLYAILERKQGDKPNPPWQNSLESIKTEMATVESVTNPIKFYQNCVNRTSKIWSELLPYVINVGQLQLLRNSIIFHLNKASKFNGTQLESSLRSLNTSLVTEIKTTEACRPSEEFLSVLSQFFDHSGINNPYNKIYITSYFNEDYAITLFVFVIAHLNKLFYLRGSSSIHKKTNQQIDGSAFAIAIHTLTKQFNTKLNQMFMKLLVQYATQLTRYSINFKSLELPPEIPFVMNFLESYTSYSSQSRSFMKQHFPEEIFHLQQTLTLQKN